MIDGSTVTIVGRVATPPTLGVGNYGEKATFRVVSTERRRDEGTASWVDGDEFGVTVVCWRRVAEGVRNSIRKGDPIVVVGRISTRKWEREGAEPEWFTEVKADVIGMDVARMQGRLEHVRPAFGEPAATDAFDRPAVPAQLDAVDGQALAALAAAAEPLVPVG
jgi:single-strand DNA-binding protein